MLLISRVIFIQRQYEHLSYVKCIHTLCHRVAQLTSSVTQLMTSSMEMTLVSEILKEKSKTPAPFFSKTHLNPLLLYINFLLYSVFKLFDNK